MKRPCAKNPNYPHGHSDPASVLTDADLKDCKDIHVNANSQVVVMPRPDGLCKSCREKGRTDVVKHNKATMSY